MAKKTKLQVAKFRELAHRIGADQSEKRFDAALKRVAKASPKPTKKARGVS